MHARRQPMIDWAIRERITISDADVAASAVVREIATDFIATYRGRNTFVQNVAVFLADRGYVSNAQMRGALNVMIAEARAERSAADAYYTNNPGARAHEAAIEAAAERGEYRGPQPIAAGVNTAGGVYIDLRSERERVYDAAIGDGAAAQRPATPAPVTGTVTAVIPNGYYTIILDNGDYRTLRVSTADRSFFAHLPAGAQTIAFLSGADNTSNYTGCAFLLGGADRMWSKFARDGALAEAVKKLVRGYEAGAAEYVKRSGNCFVCGRRLTTPDSIAAGIGPVCRQKIGASFDTFDFSALATAAAAATATPARIAESEASAAHTPARKPQTIAERRAAYAEADELFSN